MDKAELPTKNWAILIGINRYINDRPLKGCVRDVEAIEKYLRTGTRANNIDIVTLTIEGSLDIDPRSPQKELVQLPTYKNVTDSLTRVLQSSRPGDLVYIHFSGHGTRNPHSEALALVLFDQEHGSRLLHGQLLASILERMTDKGLFVTLVLDCCFSGSNLRLGDGDTSSVRMMDYDPAMDIAYPPAEYSPKFTLESSPWRDAHLLPQWLLHPNYTIFMACGPHEIAEELETEATNAQTGVRRGALSYFLLEALISLRRSNVAVSQSSLYQHLLTKFHVYWPRQTPMRRGNENLSFFGKLQFEADLSFVPIFKVDSGRICLDAGNVHDVHEGDEYALFPFNKSETTSKQKESAGLRFRVDTVRCFTSELVTIVSTYETNQIETGWKASLITRFPAWSIRVRILNGIKNRDRWITAAGRTSSIDIVVEDDDKKHCLFNVLGDPRSGEYEILDASYKKMAGSPSIPVNQDDAVEHVVGTLQHLAKFKRFEGISNRAPSTSFEQSFTISSNSEIGATGYYHVEHGKEWPISVENLGEKPLYLTIFDLCQSGQIKNLMFESGINFIVVEPRKKYVGSVKLELPDYLRRGGYNECVDVMKIFIANRATYFPAEVLPKMTQATPRWSQGSRGVYDLDPLANFLSVLESQFRGTEDEAWVDCWASRNYLIRTIAG